jgi:hypothetical protein
MAQQVGHLPNRFPVGTRYVIEGRGGHVSLRYLEFPDGRKVHLPTDLAARSSARARGRRIGLARRKGGPKKILNPAGTKPRMPG